MLRVYLHQTFIRVPCIPDALRETDSTSKLRSLDEVGFKKDMGPQFDVWRYDFDATASRFKNNYRPNRTTILV